MHLTQQVLYTNSRNVCIVSCDCTSQWLDLPHWIKRWNKPSISSPLWTAQWEHNAQCQVSVMLTSVYQWTLVHSKPKIVEIIVENKTVINVHSIPTLQTTKITTEIGKRMQLAIFAARKGILSRTAELSSLNKLVTPKVEPTASLRDSVVS